MGIASMVIGIVSAILGFIPMCGWFATLPAVVGLILGIVDVVQKNKNQQPGKGIGIAGIILNSIAIILILIWTFVIVAASATAEFD
ncbi:MAG: DUF4190 domain-containing protein [candidate division WOR-3 bacterium]|nr:MAG: DUF4190 domain-containing protein [candidate division WOR-3 bacterium]